MSWKSFYVKKSRTLFTCNLCGRDVKTSGNTSNLISHIKNKHYHAFLACKNKNQKVEAVSVSVEETSDKDVIPTTTESVSTGKRPSSQGTTMKKFLIGHSSVKEAINVVSEASTSDNNYGIGVLSQPSTSRFTTRNPSLTQSNITECMTKITSYNEGGPKEAACSQALVYMICSDNLPYCSVEKRGLLKYSKTLNPQYKLPSRKKVTNMISKKYIMTKSVIVKIFEEAKWVSLTSDIVTVTNSSRSFLIMTAHIMSCGELQSFSVAAKRLTVAHTAENIVERYWKEISENFNINNSVIVSITTDSAASMIAASNSFLPEKRIPCVAHIINLIVDDALKIVANFITVGDQIKRIVTFFKQSVQMSDQLRAEQEAAGKKEGNVKMLRQEVNTRWNSCYDVMGRFYELSGLVAKLLADRSNMSKRNIHNMLTSSQLLAVQDFLLVLAPLKEATEELSGENYTTCSLVLPIAQLLHQTLSNLVCSTDAGMKLKESLIKGVEVRLLTLENNYIFVRATLLDPRFKKSYLASPLIVATAIQAIGNEIQIEEPLGAVRENDFFEDAAVETSSTSIWSYHSKFARTSTQSLVSGMPKDLKNYFEHPLIGRREDPLKYWLQYSTVAPALSAIALRALTPPATSVPSERAASTVNYIVQDNRSRLTAAHIEERTFLNSLNDKYWY